MQWQCREEIIQKSFNSQTENEGENEHMTTTLLGIKDKLLELSKKKEDINTILLAFMMGRPMEEEQFPTDLPHAILVIHYDACSYPHRMWLTEDSVIFETSTNDVKSFRQFHNDHKNVVPLLKNILNSLKNNNEYSTRKTLNHQKSGHVPRQSTCFYLVSAIRRNSFFARLFLYKIEKYFSILRGKTATKVSNGILDIVSILKRVLTRFL